MFFSDIFLWDSYILTNSFGYVNLKKSNRMGIFNIGFKRDLIQRLNVGKVEKEALLVRTKRMVQSGEQMNQQVKKVLGQKGLILMSRV